MVKAKRNGVVITINDSNEEALKSSINFYLNRGYDIYKDGKLFKKAIPVDVPTLQFEYVRHTKEIEELKQEVERLKKELEKVSSKKKEKEKEEAK